MRKPLLLPALLPLSLAVGCGGIVVIDSSSGSEGSTSSSGSGAGGSVSGPKKETIFARLPSGAGLAGVHVFTSDAAGHVVEETETDASGHATLDVPLDGSATVAEELGMVGQIGHTFRFRTYLGIPDGGAVTSAVADPAQASPPEPMKTVSLHMPAIPSGAAKLRVGSSCHPYDDVSVGSIASNTIELDDFRPCAALGTYDVIVLALGSKGELLGSSWIGDALFTPGASVTHELTFTPPPAPATELHVSGVPGGAVTSDLWVDGIRHHDGVVVLDTPVFKGGLAPGSSSFTPALSTGVFDAWRVGTFVDFDDTEHGFSVSREFDEPALPPSYSVDVSQIPIGVPTPPDASDPHHVVARWKFQGTVTQDAVQLRITWDDGMGASPDAAWEVVAPPVAEGSARFPDVPAFAASWIPVPGSLVGDSNSLVDRDDVDNYADYLTATGAPIERVESWVKAWP